MQLEIIVVFSMPDNFGVYPGHFRYDIIKYYKVWKAFIFLL